MRVGALHSCFGGVLSNSSMQITTWPSFNVRNVALEFFRQWNFLRELRCCSHNGVLNASMQPYPDLDLFKLMTLCPVELFKDLRCLANVARFVSFSVNSHSRPRQYSSQQEILLLHFRTCMSMAWTYMSLVAAKKGE